MTSTPTRLLSVSSSAIFGPHATGAVRGWVDSDGEITVVRTAGMDTAEKLRIAFTLMNLVENEGLNPKGVAFL